MAVAAALKSNDFGSKPVSLRLDLGKPDIPPSPLGPGLQELYRNGQLSDIALVCAEQRLRAHRMVLAAQSVVFREFLTGLAPSPPGQTQELNLIDIANPEAVKFMLDYLYQVDANREYNPRSQEINKDVLRLAQKFDIPGLGDRAVRFLAKDLSTGNVVERLTVCEDFGLGGLRDKILEQLTINRQALGEVAHDPQIMTYPRLMQAMLQCAASVQDCGPPPAPGPAQGSLEERPQKKGRKA
mmetsp:Transcript_2239/g.3863  ORF Transcript_2239/g.3863 Transcript_2239/m.3863 type:complete len:241 (-) Transcript_2239:134-856(-)